MVGGLSVLVPGELRGLEAIHRKHGRLPWRELFQPAIHLAQDGFEVNRDLFIACPTFLSCTAGHLMLTDAD
jgi:gamma-glutamyltranspeptidase/glutathione hydrolase